MDPWTHLDGDAHPWEGAPASLTFARPAWQVRSACMHADPELFFPERGQVAAAALKVCATCPVRQPCLTFALATDAVGVWGGTSDADRRALREAEAA